MNIPQNYRTSKTDSLEKPRVLDSSNYRYHYMNAGGLVQPLVFWSMPYGDTETSPTGTHDGIRDGFSSGAKPRGWTRYYCSLKDWLDAGNKYPE